MLSEFHIGDVVWAKIVGYPWWPGVVNLFLLQISEHPPQNQSPVQD